MNGPSWEHFEHQSDIGVRGYGPSMEEAFENAALAVVAVEVDLSDVLPKTELHVECVAVDHELLLVDWLNAVIAAMSSRCMAFTQFHVEIEHTHLRGRLIGEQVDPTRHVLGTEVKGATYAELKVHQLPNGLWLAQCIVDV